MKARLPQGMGGGPGNMNSMIRQAQKMQEDMQNLQAELDEREYEVSAGGGAVTVKINGRREILDMIAGIRRERGISVVLVSHSMEDVAEYVDRIIVMNDGYIAMDGTPHEVFTHAEELTAMGLDVPDVTRLFMRLKADGFDVRTDIFTPAEAEAELKKLIR